MRYRGEKLRTIAWLLKRRTGVDLYDHLDSDDLGPYGNPQDLGFKRAVMTRAKLAEKGAEEEQRPSEPDGKESNDAGSSD